MYVWARGVLGVVFCLVGAVWIAQFGRLLDKKPSNQQGILYDKLVNTVRAGIPASVSILHAKALSAVTGPGLQRLALSSGEEITARLIVLANGLSLRLGHGLGMRRDEVSPCHSLTIGFDLKPLGRASFEFPALTYYPERISSRMALVTSSTFPASTSSPLRPCSITVEMSG